MTVFDVPPLDPDSRCPSVVSKWDAWWNGFDVRCELPKGHPGPHVAAHDACEPKAGLSWVTRPGPQ